MTTGLVGSEMCIRDSYISQQTYTHSRVSILHIPANVYTQPGLHTTYPSKRIHTAGSPYYIFQQTYTHSRVSILHIPANVPDPIRIGSGSDRKHRSEADRTDDSCTPACFRTGSISFSKSFQFFTFMSVNNYAQTKWYMMSINEAKFIVNAHKHN